ncbi:MAG: OB-fold nucleic acid binding domain-containing protein [Methanoregulaceae archaeon]|nr:nucleic acid-binding protein [Methanoregulaceae archaeon]MCU0628388.1 OB-fold nucleic acid binding domain-containing protein [Methanoregulaceae archaeon]
MQFHYALVDDLVSRDEFERRIEAKMQECGDLIDDVTAAMLVVGELGRQHVKISGLSGPSTLFSFFGKVISVAAPKEFTRQDGEKGWVAHLILADETGQVRAVLWDEKAAAATEIETGDVLEVIGKHAGKQKSDIAVLALRKSPCEIECGTSVQPRLAPPERKDIRMRVLYLEEPRTITRRDGSTSELIEGCVTDGARVTRVATWLPELFDDILPGMTLIVRGALVKARSWGTEYVIDEKSEMTPDDMDIPFSFSRLAMVNSEGDWSVEGTISSLQPVRAFSSRDGRPGHVRNLVLSDGETSLRAVLWGNRALLPLVKGDRVSLYNARLKQGRAGDPELHLGTGGFVVVAPPGHQEEMWMEGTVIVTREGTFIDNGTVRFLVGRSLPHGHEVSVKGGRSGERITVGSVEDLEKDAGKVRSLLEKLAGAP